MTTERRTQETAAKLTCETVMRYHWVCADQTTFSAIAPSRDGAFRVLNAERPGMLARPDGSTVVPCISLEVRRKATLHFQRKIHMKNILVLDDLEIRHVGFNKQFPNENVICCFTIEDFLDKVRGGPFCDGTTWDLICFDHDLNDGPHKNVSQGTYGGTSELTGRDAARSLVAMGNSKFPARCLVHSVNPDGAKAIHGILSDAGIPTQIFPFTNFKF